MKRHREANTLVSAEASALFERLDDQTRLAEHMGQSSLMMGGGHMTYDFDEGLGQTVGSRIRMGGEAFGLSLFVEEIVVERAPPRRKVWRTVGAPRLIIIGPYEMGFEITPAEEDVCRLRVWIDYEAPARGLGRRTPRLAAFYARWCVQRMVGDAARHFGHPARA
ncbi:SRPBCC family protein [Phenylobacterium sp.]|uniref:SRPBCC family protein n=1 Tax=Phenylobacterium sp. TaxID=1871053 RepID=UPI0027368D9C|nr:SRPBCC family protein [Phenylobacterium sp.]MDP3853329.1 SRPBCC family protein [Phenylobacterium sp.]